MPGVRRNNKISELLREQVKGNVWYSKGLMHNGSDLINLLEYGWVQQKSLPANNFWQENYFIKESRRS